MFTKELISDFHFENFCTFYFQILCADVSKLLMFALHSVPCATLRRTADADRHHVGYLYVIDTLCICFQTDYGAMETIKRCSDDTIGNYFVKMSFDTLCCTARTRINTQTSILYSAHRNQTTIVQRTRKEEEKLKTLSD